MNIQAMMQQAKKMQAEMEKGKQELAKQEFVVEKQGVKVIFSGDKVMKSLVIDEALVDPEDKDIIEDLVVIAINEAISTIDEAEAELMPQQPNMPF